MAYATISDMVERFGEIEMIRISSRDNALLQAIDGPRVQLALDDATALIDSSLRARYAVPLSPVPREVTRACCILARYDLTTSGEQTPSEQLTKDRKATLDWLGDMASSEGKLDALPARAASDARVRDRARLIDGVALP